MYVLPNPWCPVRGSWLQVRMGTEKDPEHEDKTGSNPLRQGCPTEEALRKGFSFVYLSRTVKSAVRMRFVGLVVYFVFVLCSCECG